MGFMKASKRAANVAQWQADNQAKETVQREEKRAVNLTDGANRINAAFDSFQPEYFQGVEDNVKTLGMSDLNKQFAKARESLMFALARSGMLSSSVANQGAVDIATQNNESAAKIDLQAKDASTRIRSGVEQERAGAISQLYATENPDLAANTANARSALIMQDKPTYNPLGDIFAGVISAYDNYKKGAGGGANFVNTSGPDTSTRRSGSERVVG